MDLDQSSPAAEEEQQSEEPWQKTRAGKRIAELNEVEENIAALLHFAGCALASLHPEPLSNFTSRELATDDDEAEEGGAREAAKGKDTDKGDEFAKYAEGYYATLNDTQLALRTSIRHLRLSRVSPAPLLDPSFASLSRPGAAVGVGGVALGELLKPLGGGEVRWRGTTGKKEGESEGERDEEGGRGRLSVAALELEKEGWEEVVRALEKSRSG